MLDLDIPLRGKNDSNFATGKLGGGGNLRLLYPYDFRGQTLESLLLLPRTLTFLKVLWFIHTLLGICIGNRFSILKKTSSSIATPNSPNSDIKSLVFMELKGYLFSKRFSEVFPKNTEFP